MVTQCLKATSRILLQDPKQLLTMIQAGLAMGVAFGLNLSAEQLGAIVAFLSSFILWLNSQQPSPQDMADLTKAAEGAIRAKNMELEEVKKQAVTALEGQDS